VRASVPERRRDVAERRVGASGDVVDHPVAGVAEAVTEAGVEFVEFDGVVRPAVVGVTPRGEPVLALAGRPGQAFVVVRAADQRAGGVGVDAGVGGGPVEQQPDDIARIDGGVVGQSETGAAGATAAGEVCAERRHRRVVARDALGHGLLRVVLGGVGLGFLLVVTEGAVEHPGVDLRRRLGDPPAADRDPLSLAVAGGVVPNAALQKELLQLRARHVGPHRPAGLVGAAGELECDPVVPDRAAVDLVAEIAVEKAVRVLSVDLELLCVSGLVGDDDLKFSHTAHETAANKKHVETVPGRNASLSARSGRCRERTRGECVGETRGRSVTPARRRRTPPPTGTVRSAGSPRRRPPAGNRRSRR